MIRHHKDIYIANTEMKGRGVFSKIDLPKGTLIEVAPVIVLAPSETQKIHETILHDYYFAWGEDQKSSAIALGYVSLFNHNPDSNCTIEANFEDNLISVKSLRDVKAGEELTINYNLDAMSERKLWFDEK